MILKIRDGMTWVFRDGIVRIRVYDPCRYRAASVKDVHDTGEIEIEDDSNKAEQTRRVRYFTGFYSTQADGQFHEAHEVWMTDRSGIEHIYLIGATFYLLNDTGQTVERFGL